MHFYVYDEYTNKPKYKEKIRQVEKAITDLEIIGKIVRLKNAGNIFRILFEAIKNNAKTIVAIGNDITLNKTIHNLLYLSEKLNFYHLPPVGLIPIGKKNQSIAEKLNLNYDKNACKHIACRYFKKIDIGELFSLQDKKKYYFLSHAAIKTKNTKIKLNSFFISSHEKGIIQISNFPDKNNINNFDSSYDDNIFELNFNIKKKRYFLFSKNEVSQFKFKNIYIENNQNNQIILDNNILAPLPANIKILPSRINLIINRKKI